MSGKAHFSSETFLFLRDLAENNDREWFNCHKHQYEEHVKLPALEFIRDFAPHLEDLSPHFRADPRPTGGSMFRIYRDVRFSRDKSPYKTSLGIQFRHEKGKGAHAPGFYLHVEPGNSFVGLGIWRPDGKTLRAIRGGMVENPESWEQVVSDSPFREHFQLTGDRLVRPPRGFDPEHRLIEDLKWKDYVASAPLIQETVTSPGFLEEYGTYCRAGLPFVAFLCRTLELPV